MRPRCLILDGGGISGVSQLETLDALMRRMGDERDEVEPHPYDYFDIILGSGTGGLNAILIGRLKIPVRECIRIYNDLRTEVFVQQSGLTTWIYDRLFSDQTHCAFDAQKLERFVKDLVRKYTGDENALLCESENPKCRVSVTVRQLADSNLFLLSNYETLYGTGSGAGIRKDCRIWEAIRATMASVGLFPPITIGKSMMHRIRYCGADLGANNPILLLHRLLEDFSRTRALEEKHDKRDGNSDDYGFAAPNACDHLYEDSSDVEPVCVISIGTGKQRIASLPTDWAQQSQQKILAFWERIAEDSEQAHLHFQDSWDSRGKRPGYYRFNVENGLQDVNKREWSEGVARSAIAHTRTHNNRFENKAQFEEAAYLLRYGFNDFALHYDGA